MQQQTRTVTTQGRSTGVARVVLTAGAAALLLATVQRGLPGVSPASAAAVPPSASASAVGHLGTAGPDVPASSTARSAPRTAERTEVDVRVDSVERVGRLTGPDSVNDTAARWGVYGTDLGHMFWHGGSLYMVFGDTWGADGVEGSDWRSNTMARIDEVEDGQPLRFAAMVTDRPGHAAELLASRKVDGVEKTVIPTGGISTGSRMVLHYMSVNHWGAPGFWELNRSGLAYSDDDGQTWMMAPDATWPGDSNFGQVAFVADGGWVHLFGIPGGRQGGVQLARVRPDDILDLTAYTYFDGREWQPDRSAAATIVPAPVGELSVGYNRALDRWLMLALDGERGAIVLRSAPALTGPWSEPTVVTTAADHPQLYAPYLVPGVDTGDDILFTMSRFDEYEVSLMRAHVTAAR